MAIIGDRLNLYSSLGQAGYEQARVGIKWMLGAERKGKIIYMIRFSF